MSNIINEDTSVQFPLKALISTVLAVAMGLTGYLFSELSRVQQEVNTNSPIQATIEAVSNDELVTKLEFNISTESIKTLTRALAVGIQRGMLDGHVQQTHQLTSALRRENNEVKASLEKTEDKILEELRRRDGRD